MRKIYIGLLILFAANIFAVNTALSQCTVTNTGTAAAPTCSDQSLSLGAGESRNMTFTSGYAYVFSFSNNAQSSGYCINGTRYTSNQTFNNLSGTVAVGMYRNTGTWASGSATLTYRLATPGTPGAPSVATNGCTQVTVQWGAATDASGYEVQLSTASDFSSTFGGNNCGGSTCGATVDLGNVTSTTLTGLTAGNTYYFRVRARNGNVPCRSGFSSTLTFVAASNASISSFTRTDNGTYCVGGSGTVTVNPAGGTGTYTYSWGSSGSGSGQSTATSATNNSTAGAYTYSVTVTPSGSGCAAASNSTTMTSYNDPVAGNPTGGASICKGGSLTLSSAASGGVPSSAYTYFWRYNGNAVANATPNGFTYTGTQNLTIATTNASTATAGAYNYLYYVTQSQSGCQSANSGNGVLTLANDPTATINAPYGGASNCVVQTGVTLNVTTAGGVSPTYNWQRFDSPSWTNVQSNNSAYNTGTLTNTSTQYQFVFSDAGPGCDAVTSSTATLYAIPYAPTVLNGSTQTGCGQVVVGVSPATYATTCRFYNGFLPNGSPTSSGTSYSYTTPGTYTLYVTSYNPTTGCESSAYATVSVVVSPSFTSTISTSNYNGYAVACIGGNNGTVTVSTTGATTPINYVWSNGAQTLNSGSASNTINTLSAGNYTVTVTDVNNCVKIENATLSSPTAISSTISTSNNNGYSIACNGGNDGTATINPSGGIPPYTYVWQGGGTSQTRTNYSAGNYSVTVTDANSCTYVNSVDVTQPTALSFTYSVGYVCNGSTYSSANIVINAAGGTGNYQYSITNGSSWQTSNTFSGLSSGPYTLRIKDVNNGNDCIGTGQAITVTIPSSVQASESCGYTYATANGGDPTGTFATPSCPVTLSRALYLVTNDASFASRKHIIVTSGTYTLTGPVLIPADVIIDGGYDNTNAAQWTKTSNGVTNITINSTVETAVQSGVTVGFVRGIVINGNNVQLKDLTINVNTTSPVTGSTSNRGRSVYGVYADSKTGILISRCNITTGPGSSGDAGSGGSNGSNGSGGAAASPQGGCDDSPYQNGGSGGAGATVSWGSNGGAGGGGGFSEEGNAGDGGTGANGTNNIYGGGGGGSRGSDGGSCGTGGNANSGSGGPGGAGDNSINTVATSGTDYNPASPASASHTFGTFYLPSGQAAQGGNGRAGSGGGGGGGTRGENTDFYCPYNDNSGNPGAGGGGGGAGGQGGFGGYGGGGSFPVFFSSGTGEVRDCALNPGAGGSGGTGGTGGAGGYGGASGGGSCYCQSDRACSGSGGAGGNGARGGRGQTGATGASLGFTTTNSSSVAQNGTSVPNPTTVSATWTQGCRRSEITLTKSSAGATWDNFNSGNDNPVLVNDLTSSSTSYTTTTNSVKVYYGSAASVGNKDITVNGQTYRNFIKIVGDRAYGDAVINAISSPCPNASITLGTPTAGSNISDYDWTIQLLSNPSVNVLTYTGQNPGAVGPPVGGWTAGATYQVKLRVKENCCGWSIPAFTTFTVLAVPAQPSTIVAADPIVCANQTGAGYSVTNVSGTTYTWVITSGSGNIASGQGTNAVTVNWGSTGAAVLQVTPSNGCGSGTARTLSITVNSNPTASISPLNPTICSGVAQTFTASATAGSGGNGNFTYLWSTSATSNTISPVTPNNYSVTVTEGLSGCTASNTTTLSNYPPFSAGTINSTTEYGCATYDPSTISQVAAPSGSGSYGYQWQLQVNSGGWNNISGAIASTYDPSALNTVGVYEYRRNVTDNTCGNSATSSGIKTINIVQDPQPPTGTVSPGLNACIGSTVTITSPTLHGGGVSPYCNDIYYRYDLTGTGSSYTAWSMTVPSIAANSTGTILIQMRVQCTASPTSCSVSNPTTYTITVSPTSVAGTASANQAICTGATPAALTLSGYTGTIQWQYATDLAFTSGVTTISGATSATLSAAQMGALTATRYYRATVTSGGCTSANSNVVTITVNQPIGTLTANLSANPICEGASLGLSASVASGTGITYNWAGPNGYTANTQNATRNPILESNGEGVYSVTATNSCGNATASTAALNVHRNIIGLGNDATPNPICEGSDLSLSADYTGTPLPSTDVTWTWSGPNGFSANVQNPTVTAIAVSGGGVYYVSATNACGTQTSGSPLVQVDQQIAANADLLNLAAAGPDPTAIEACGAQSFTLHANNPAPGTGVWSQLPAAGTSTFSPNAGSKDVTVTYSQFGTAVYAWTITNGVCPPDESDIRVVFDPAINITADLSGCSFTSADSIMVQVSGTGGGTGLTFGAPSTDELRVDINSSTKAFTTPMDGGLHTYSVSDAYCTQTADVAVPAGHPLDIPLTVSPGTAVANCYENRFTKWTTFSNNNNEAILSLFDNDQDLGLVNVTVYKDPTTPEVLQAPGGGSCAGYYQTALQRHFVITSTAAQPFTRPVSVRLYFSNEELDSLIDASIGNNQPGDLCSGNDDVTSISDLYVTKYSGPDEDGDYTNNSPAGIYKVYGNPTSLPTQPDGPLSKAQNGFSTLYLNGANHHYVDLAVTEFSEMWLHGSGTGSALPVEMIYFEANAINNSYIQLKWATLLEVNNSGFQVERSTDGTTWNTIGWVDGHNNTTVQQNYTYDDKTVVGGIRYYYRLKQVDNDGQYEYTGIVSAIINVYTAFDVKEFIPNPALNYTDLVITSATEQTIQVSIYNEVGQIAMNGKYTITKGNNRITFDVGNLAAGTYTATVKSANGSFGRKLVIAK